MLSMAMFPPFFSAPPTEGVVGLPFQGALITWFVIASLVGTMLGLLRERATNGEPFSPPGVGGNGDHRFSAAA